MNKKNLVGAGAIISAMISIWLGVWYTQLPSFDQMEDVSFATTNSTFEEVIK